MIAYTTHIEENSSVTKVTGQEFAQLSRDIKMHIIQIEIIEGPINVFDFEFLTILKSFDASGVQLSRIENAYVA